MPNLAPQPRAKVVRALTRAYGFSLQREGGRHTIFCKSGVPEAIAVPRHDAISPGVMRNICKVLGVSVRSFLEVLRNC
jgi:predicted RNA binding protein YcfA (HicA-like mRNA interferase family)